MRCGVARFYFHIVNGGGRCVDEDGVELPSQDHARAHAIAGIRSILAEEMTEGAVDLSGRIEVTNEEGTELFAVRYSDAVQIMGERS
jgi:hypothetical protein